MARRWLDPNAFRADPAAPAGRPTRRQAAALLSILVLVAGVLAAVSYLIQPERARAFHLLSGSIFLADAAGPVAVDLATGSPSLRLIDATAQVDARPQNLSVVPLDPGGGTLLLNRTTGEFDMVDPTGFVIKRDTGVPLPALPNTTMAVGQPAHDTAASDLAYIEQSSKTRTRVYLVSQATVREAIVAKHVKPRASASIDAPGSADPGARASAEGALWILTGSGLRRSITQLSLPKRSQANGATLRQVSHGTVLGPAALGSAAASENAQQSVVGVASGNGIEVFSSGGRSRTVPYASPPGLDRVLAASNQTGRLAFLLHGNDGWSLVSVGIDGKNLRGPTPLAKISPTADLAPPSASGDTLYTADRGSGRLWRIGLDGAATKVPGAPARYPRLRIEPQGWADTYVIASGDRVFYDSPSHNDALAVFTDGARSPLIINKSHAVGVNALADAWALSRSRNRQPPRVQKAGGSPPPPPPPVAAHPLPIDNSINCDNPAQNPRAPQVHIQPPGSTWVTLSWQYPFIPNRDCLPQKYQVTANPVGDSAVPLASPFVYQTSPTITFTLTNLYPSTTYEITVTAFIGSRTTPSSPQQIKTAPKGPDAPEDVQVRTDAHGDWILRWDSCGTLAPDCIPSSSWNIQPTVCGGQRAVVGALPSRKAHADPTTRPQPAFVYHGGTALLGRGLSFRIMGSGVDGLPGAPSAPTPCTASWAPPIASALKLSASTPNKTAFGTTATAKAVLNLGTDPVRDVGGVGAKVTFTLTGNGTTQTKAPIVIDGSRSTVSAAFPDITPGARYTATASVQPAHGGSPVILTSLPLSTRSRWPDYQANAVCAQTLLSCSLQVGFTGISSADSRGELFALTNASQIRCNNTAMPLNRIGFDPGTSPVTATLSQLDGLYGQCRLTVQLVEDTAARQPVYGGIPSPVHTLNVDLGPPTHANVGHDDLNAQWDSSQGGSSVRLTYTGTQDLADLTTNWSETVTAPGGDQQCGSAQVQPANSALIAVDPNCVNQYGAQQPPWTVTVQYTNRVDGTPGGTFAYQLPGPPPSYQPCDPQGLAASWGATQADGISVTLGANANIAGCSEWTYGLYDNSTSPPTQVCPDATGRTTGPPPVQIDTTQCGTPGDNWFVRVSWLDTAGQQQQQDLPLGAPPPS